MAEIKPYSFEPMRDSSKIKISAEEEIHSSVYSGVVRPGKCNKRKNVYAASRRSTRS